MKMRFSTILTERMIRRATLFLTAAVLATLTACKSDGLQRTQLTQQELTTYSKAIAGIYGGSYTILWSDQSMPWHKNEDGTTSRESVRETKEGASITVTDRDMHSIVFHSFPVSTVSHVVVGDDALKAALAEAPDMDFSTKYQFGLQADDEQPIWRMEAISLPLTLTYGGQEHHILLSFKAGAAYVLDKAKQDAGLGFSEIGGLSFSLDGILVDGGTSHSQVLWVDDVSLNAVFRMG